MAMAGNIDIKVQLFLKSLASIVEGRWGWPRRCGACLQTRRSSHTWQPSTTLVEQNLLQIVELYLVVELEYTLAGNPDKVFHSVLDQGRGCLMAFDDTETDTMSTTAINTLKQAARS
ncbi:hypothetical protein B0H14DRAFT_2573237 [Mycena olivaceomarginata]|nr:hypothetical protein B0H14DRAFT_2573237 [Mycena olivaceomarginata]